MNFRSMIYDVFEMYGCDIIIINKTKFINNEAIENIIVNKEEYKEFIKCLKKMEGETSLQYGANHPLAMTLREFYRNETKVVRKKFGGFLDNIF